MKISWFSLYNVVLALWVAGMSILTFLVAPVILNRMEKIWPAILWGTSSQDTSFVISSLQQWPLALFFLITVEWKAFASRLSLVLLAAALIVNVFIVFKLYPEAVKAKQEVTSFEQESPARWKFTRLRTFSATLNLFLIVDGITLLIAIPAIKKLEIDRLQ